MKTEILPTIGEKLQSIKRDKQATADFIAKTNPSLVCAAPELLAALERARDHLIMDIDRDRKGLHSHDTPEALAQARAAIAKAEGRAE